MTYARAVTIPAKSRAAAVVPSLRVKEEDAAPVLAVFPAAATPAVAIVELGIERVAVLTAVVAMTDAVL